MKIIHILGAPGSGTTSLGRALARSLGWIYLDTDRYTWADTPIPFTVENNHAARRRLLQTDLVDDNNYVIAGSMCGWGDCVVPHLSLAIYIDTPDDVRADRIHRRGLRDYGERILPGGDMHKTHIDFIRWAMEYDQERAPERCRPQHQRWLADLSCPVIQLDGQRLVVELLSEIQKSLDD
jgi:adenylate kinase family enzyme